MICRTLVVIAFLALTGSSERAWSHDTKGEAQKHFEAGTALMKFGNFEEAAIEFEVSIKAHPTKNALFNLANCYKATRRYSKALETYEILRKQFANSLSDEMCEKIDEDVKNILSLIAEIELQVEQKNATIKVDGEEVGKSPLTQLVIVGSGTHEIEVSMDGYETTRFSIQVIAGDRKKQTISLNQIEEVKEEPEPELKPEPEPEPVVEVKSGSDTLRTVGWVTTGVGAALLVGGVVTGAMAMSKDGEIEDNCPGGECDPKWEDTIDSRDKLGIVTNVLLGVGAAAAVAGIVMVVVSLKGNGKEETVAFVPVVGPEIAGASLEWRF